MYQYNVTPQENIDLAKLRIGNIGLEEYINSANLIVSQANKQSIIEGNNKTNTTASQGQVVGDTLGEVATDVFQGFSKALEGLVDFGAGFVGTIAGLVGGRNAEEIFADFIEKDNTQALIDDMVNENTFSASAINNMSETGRNIVKGVSQGVGGMIPTIAVSVATAGLGASAMVSQIASLTQMGISATGNATEEALNDYYIDANGNKVRPSLDRAFLYGLANGCMEVATETIIGGAYSSIFGKGLLDGVVNNLVRNIKFGKIIGWMINNVGEGVEEIVSAVFEDTLKTIYNSDKVHWVTPDLQKVIENGIIGTLTAVVLGGATKGVSKISSKNTIAQALSSMEENNEWASNLQEKQRFDEKRSSSYYAEQGKQLITIEKRLKAMSPEKRAKIFTQMPQLFNYFENDGTRIETAKLDAGVSSLQNVDLARQNGTMDARITDTNKVANDLKYAESRLGEGSNVRVAIDLNGDQMTRVKKLRTLTSLSGSRTGQHLNIVVFEDDIVDTAKDSPAFINGNTMYINKKALNEDIKLARAWSHEQLGHFTEGTKAHALFIEEIKKLKPELYNAVEEEINQQSFYSESEKQTEIEARLIEEVIGNDLELIDKLVARHSGTLGKLADILKTIGKKLKAVFTMDKSKLGETETLEYIRKLNKTAKYIEKVLSVGGYKNIKSQERENIKTLLIKKLGKKAGNVANDVIEKEGLASQFSYATWSEPVIRTRNEENGEIIMKSGKQILQEQFDKNLSKIEDEKVREQTKRAYDKIIKDIDNVADVVLSLSKDFASIKRFLNARPYYKSDGSLVLSALVSNGEYEVNIDFTTICKKREQLSMFLQDFIEKGYNFGKQGGLTHQAIEELNNLFKKYGLDTACSFCFVEAKRQDIDNWSNKIIEYWNNALKEKGVKDATPISSVEGLEQIDTIYGINGEITQDTLDKISVAFADDVNSQTADDFKDRGKDFYKKMLDYIDHYKTDEKNYPIFSITKNDLLNTKVITFIKWNAQNFYSFLLNAYGQANPKMLLPATPYASDLFIPNMSDEQWKKDRAKLSENVTLTSSQHIMDIGGARINSFSDFQITRLLDYVNFLGDCTAKGYAVQTYTKELGMVKLFGKSGIKGNISAIFEVDLNYMESFKNIKDAQDYAGLDRDGNLILSSDTKIDYFNEAVRLQDQDGIKGDWGICAVGLSKYHILKLMADDRFKMIIPYHSSGMPSHLKQFFNHKFYFDYTRYQTTKKWEGTKWDAMKSDIFNDVFYKAYHEKGGDYYYATRKYLEYCQEHQLKPRFAFEWDVNKSLDENITNEKNYMLGYKDGDKIVGNPNYFKVLIDYTSDGGVDENGNHIFKEQKAVELNLDGIDVKKIAMEEATKLEKQYDLYNRATEGDRIFKDFCEALQGELSDTRAKEIRDTRIEKENKENTIPSAENDETASVYEQNQAQFSVVTDKNLLQELEDGEKIRVYRAMQLVDGKLYPPMSAKLNGQWKDETEIGKWYVSDEHPEKVRKDGKFPLDKGNGKTIYANYNPYWHTSRTPLNDQFTSAYLRPNLVVVEAEISRKDVESGYRADMSHDAVGEMEWHSGVVSSQLKKAGKNARKVFLSRYIKVNRIVPDSEVAKTIKKEIGNVDVVFPYNVVTPSLLKELEKQGVKISYEQAGLGEDANGRKLSKTQIKYFKESKIRDIDGKLMPMYHYSTEEFTEFDLERARKSMDIQGFYFYPNDIDGQEYGDHKYECYLNITNPYIVTNSEEAKPIAIDYRKTDGGVEVRKTLEENGYDGIIFTEEYLGTASEYIAFKPEQIKLVTNTKPTSKSDIQFAYGMHWGDLDYGRKADRRSIMAGRGSGHFGTGFYMVNFENYRDMHYDYNPTRPIFRVDMSKYHLFKPKSRDEAYRLHDALRWINNYATEDVLDIDKYYEKNQKMREDKRKIEKMEWDIENEEDYIKYRDAIREYAQKYGQYWDYESIRYEDDLHAYGVFRKYKELPEKIYDRFEERYELTRIGIKDLWKIFGYHRFEEWIAEALSHKGAEDSVSTEIMKHLGYEGIDVTESGVQGLDNFGYGSIIYDLKPNTYEKLAEPRGDDPYDRSASKGIQFSFNGERPIVVKTKEDVRKVVDGIFIDDKTGGTIALISEDQLNEIAKTIVLTAPNIPSELIDTFANDIADMILRKSTYDNVGKLFEIGDSDYEIATLKQYKANANKYRHKLKLSDHIKSELKHRYDTGAKGIILQWGSKDGRIAVDNTIEEMYEAIGQTMPTNINNEADLFMDWLDQVDEITRKINILSQEPQGRYDLNQINLNGEEYDAVKGNIREKLINVLAPYVDNYDLRVENVIDAEGENIQDQYEQLNKDKKQAKKDIDKERVRIEKKTQKIIKDYQKIVERVKENAEKVKKETAKMKSRFKLLRSVTKGAEFFRKEKLKKYPDTSMLGDDGIKQGVAVLSKLSNLNFAGGWSARGVIAEFIDIFYNDSNEKISAWFDEELYEALEQIAMNRVKTYKSGRQVNNRADLSYEELQTISFVVKTAQKIVKEYNQLQVNGKFEELDKKSEEAVKTMKDYAPMLKDNKFARAFRFLYSNAIEPRVVLELLFGMQDNVLVDLYDDICRGESKGQAMELLLASMLQTFYKKHRGYGKSLTKKVVFRGQEITKGELLTIIKQYEQEHTLPALLYSGYAIEDEKTKKIKDYDSFINKKKLLTEEEKELPEDQQDELLEERGENVLKAIVEEMYGLLTEDDKAYLETIREIMKKASEFQAETDMEYKGYTTITPESSNTYFPATRYDRDFKSESSKVLGDATRVNKVGNQSINKGRINNRRRLFIRSIDVVVLDYLHELGKYYGMAVPLKEFQRVLNFNVAKDVNKPVSIRNVITQDVWAYGLDYISKLLDDIQGISGSKSKGSMVLSKLRSGYVVASLGLNIKVILTQFASYPTAFSMLRVSSLIKAFRKVDFKKMDEFSDWANVRYRLSSATKSEGADDTNSKFADLMMKPIGLMDRAVIGLLWNACQYEVQANHKGDDNYKFGTEENMKEASILLEEVGRRTQPNYLPTERTGIQRSNSEIVKWTLGSFTSVPSKMLSRLVESTLEMNALWYTEHKLKKEVEPAKKHQIKMRFVKSATAVLTSNLLYILIAQLMKYALAKDRKDKDGKEISIWEDMAIEFGGVSAGMVPLLKDVYNVLVRGYDFDGETFSTSALSDLISLSEKAVDMVVKASNDEYISQNSVMGFIQKLSTGISTLMGVPVRNVYNQMYGIVKRFDPSSAYKMNSIFYSTSNYTKDLKKAIEEGDESLANTIMGLMLKDKGITNLSDIVTEKIRDLYEKGYNVLPRTIGDSVKIDGEEYTLSATQQKAIKNVYNEANTKVENLINGRGFNSLDEKVQAKAIKWVYDYYYEYALAQTLGTTADSKKLLYGETMPLERFALAISVCSSLDGDKDKNGTLIAGSKKAKVLRTLSKVGMSKNEREMIMAYLGYSVDESIIKRYIRSLGLSRKQQEVFLSYMSFVS